MGNVADLQVSYFTLMTEDQEQAISLARYLTEHGICANESDKEPNEVTCPVVHGSNTIGRIEYLYRSWKWFWQNTASPLLGLPVYVRLS